MRASFSRYNKEEFNIINKWHQKLISIAEEKLGRGLTESEEDFIISRKGYIALEMIEDTLSSIDQKNLIKYLNDEAFINE